MEERDKHCWHTREGAQREDQSYCCWCNVPEVTYSQTAEGHGPYYFGMVKLNHRGEACKKRIDARLNAEGAR